MRDFGVIMIQVFVPKHSGQAAALGHCDFAAQLMEMDQEVDSVNGIDVELRKGRVTDGPEEKEMLQKIVSIPFQVDGFF